MKHQQHHVRVQLSYDELRACFNELGYDTIRPNQDEAFALISKQAGGVTEEAPVGSGKTAIGMSYLKALQKRGMGPLFYIVPNKTQVDEIKLRHPEVKVVYGRNEYDCLYYEGAFKADEIPCSLLRDCFHRIDQKTGETFGPTKHRCPYYDAKWQTKGGNEIIVCTVSYFLFTQVFSREYDRPAGLVIDEVHQLAKIVRNALTYEITDYHLRRAVELLSEVTVKEAEILGSFLNKMVRIIKSKPAYAKTLLESHEIAELIHNLMEINPNVLEGKLVEAIKGKAIDPKVERELLKKVEVLIHDLAQYVRSLEYSLSTKERNPLNLTYAFYEPEPDEDKRIKYKLVIKSYFVAGLIKRMLAPNTLAMSATIGDPKILAYETWIKFPFYTIGSDFPAENTKIIIPTDTPDLSAKGRRKQDLTKTLRRIAKSTRKLSSKGLRSLVVVVSEKERQKFLMLCEEEKVNVVSYGNGLKPKDAILKFKNGEGDVLLGTVANYGEGIDLPDGQAPVTFFLRPGYQSPSDPMSQFEEKRFSGGVKWGIWNWRVMIEALQVRGRNQRSAQDRGVTIFVSQQFKRFLFASLPKWLQSSYVRGLTFDQAIQSATKMLEVYQD